MRRTFVFSLSLFGLLWIGCNSAPVRSPVARVEPPAPVIYECTDTHPASSTITIAQPAASAERCDSPIEMADQLRMSDPPPTLPQVNSRAQLAAVQPVRVVYLADRLDPQLAGMLVEIMDEGIVHKEATTLVVRDADGNLLTQVVHRRVPGSPAAGPPSKMVLHNAYLANHNGGLAVNDMHNPIPAPGASVIGYVEVAHACEAQNKRPIVALVQKLQQQLQNGLN